MKIEVIPSDFKSQRPNLNSLKSILQEEYELKNVTKSDIESFIDKDRTQSLLSDVALTTLNTTDLSPLTIRYPLSISESK